MLKPILAASALTLLLTLTGCGDPTPPITLAPTPSATPLFASDEEALAAAEAAYGAFVAALDLALSTYETGGLQDVATDQALAESVDSVGDFVDKGERLTGSSSISDSTLTGVVDPDDVWIYSCLDLSGTDVLDSQGRSSLPVNRVDHYPMEVHLVWVAQKKRLLVASEDVWGGSDFCKN